MPSLKEHYSRFYELLEQTDIMKWIISSIRHQATQGDRCIAVFMLFIYACSITAALSNLFFFHYEVSIFGANEIVLLLGPGIAWAAGIMLEKPYPYAGNLTLSLGFAALYWAVMAAGCTPLLATPFQHNVIDPFLLRWDLMLGFHQTHLINWLSKHLTFKSMLHYAYESWSFQVVLVAIFAGLWGCKRMTRLWLLASLVSFVIGGVIYFSFPSLPPAAHLISGYFKVSSYNLIDRFYQIHQHLPFVLRGSDGLIAFPSFHVSQAIINSIILWMCQRETTRFAWLLLAMNIALTVINLFLIFATLGLGFHYLVDVIAGSIVAVFSVWAALGLSESVCNKSNEKLT